MTATALSTPATVPAATPSSVDPLSFTLPRILLVTARFLALNEELELPWFLASITNEYLDHEPATLRELDRLSHLEPSLVELPFPAAITSRLLAAAEAFGVATGLIIGEALLQHLRGYVGSGHHTQLAHLVANLDRGEYDAETNWPYWPVNLTPVA